VCLCLATPLLNRTPQPWIRFCHRYIISHHILLEGPLELHTSIALSHTLSHHHSLHSEELIGLSIVQCPSVSNQVNTINGNRKPYFDGPQQPHCLVVPWLFQRVHPHMHEIEQHCPIHSVATGTLNIIITNSQCHLTSSGRSTWAPNSNKTITTSTQPFALARDKAE
jgi:hypothetical protein